MSYDDYWGFKEAVEGEIPGMKITEHGGACPWQAEGTYFGNPFYARFRYGSASMTTYDGVIDMDHELTAAIIDDYGATGWEGVLTDEEAFEMLKVLVTRLRPVSEDNLSSMSRMRERIQESLQRGLEQSAAGETVDLGSFTQFLTIADADLPSGYRWATEEESERYTADPTSVPGAIVVQRTADDTGKPYTQDEADLAVPDE